MPSIDSHTPSRLRHYRSLFLTSFLQVSLISANTYFVAQKLWIGIAIAGFGISYLWTINVRRVSVASRIDSVIYSLGAMLGGLVGVWIAQLISR